VRGVRSLVFGYFFYWTLRDDFPPDPAPGPGVFWPLVAAGLLAAAWLLTVLSFRWNRRDWTPGYYAALLAAVVAAALGAAALVAGPWTTNLQPARGVYAATVWLLVDWTALHVAIGVLMQIYCVARRLAGRLTHRYDAELANVVLYWHFTAITVAITIAVIAGFPLAA
jgi:cytochrome c oxidase subunit I+III